MQRDEIFKKDTSRSSDFEFNQEVAQVFDDMLVRSVPFYNAQQDMIRDLCLKFWIPNTTIYDLGCSTARTLLCLAQSLPDATLIGYDSSEPMLARARQNIAAQGLTDRIALHSGDLNAPLNILTLENASVVTLCWTLQFIRPLHRDTLIRWIYNGLVENGALLVTDKVLTNDSDMNRIFIELYYEFKRRNGYSESEILRKREALENVLIPYRIDENLELFRRNGFQIVETFFQWYNFAGFLCVKK
ncbi:MAG TPA: carboxy-S-adenosyl-L-methionine synthase CmoA [Anaerolineae bacterium]|nr:carboxy-S-adenosyl-L-methionine synthase CmoA [Anaerolineae bacterium]